MCCRHRVHRVATAAFWRSFSDEGKISPGWWGGGVHAHPLSLHLPSPVKLQCTLQLSGQIHWPCFISTNICTLWLSRIECILTMWVLYVLFNTPRRVVQHCNRLSLIKLLPEWWLTSLWRLTPHPRQLIKLPFGVQAAFLRSSGSCLFRSSDSCLRNSGSCS